MTIEHDEVDPEGRRFLTRYVHMDTNTVTIPLGEAIRLERGDFIGMAGNTGTGGIHLHFDVLLSDGDDDVLVDPYDLAGGLLRSGIRPVREHYQPESGCGPNHLWIVCPLD